MKKFSRCQPGLLLVAAVLLSPLWTPASAQIGTGSATSARQEGAPIKQLVERFLHTQSAGLPGEVKINVASIDPRLNLTACVAPQAFLPPNSRLWGRTAVGVRCNAPEPWTIYVMATVRVIGEYVTPAGPLVHGQLIGPNDITRMKGDLTALPYGIITEPEHAIGRTAARSLQAGMPIRQDAVRNARAVQQGQVVKVISSGPGFSVASEARALSNGSEGQTVQARTPAGQVVSGLARAGGVVEVVF